MILQKEAIINAARDLMTMAIDLETEEEGCSLPEDMDADLILENHADDVMLTMGIIIGKIENAWGYSIGLVFHHMGFTDVEDQSRLLYRLIMGCMGHGICLDDDGPSGPVATGFDNAGRILLNIVTDTGKRFEASPVHLDGDDPIHELISEHLEYEDTTCTA